jgi:hypothetical protein
VWAFDLGTQIERCLFFFLSYLYPEKKKEVEDMAESKEKKKYLLLTLPLSDR